MKLHTRKHLLASPPFFQSEEHAKIEQDIRDAIAAIRWPANGSQFLINPTRKGNGVKPIKSAFIEVLKRRGWRTEERLRVLSGVGPGPVDAVYELSDGSYFLVEWETGNISSSHRAINKILVAMLMRELADGRNKDNERLRELLSRLEDIDPALAKALQEQGSIEEPLPPRIAGGALVLPTRELYKYLTDRVGNYEELQPYFPLFASIPLTGSVLSVYAVEHDGVDETVPLLRKGTDGRALI